jgi:hypothetical protein
MLDRNSKNFKISWVVAFLVFLLLLFFIQSKETEAAARYMIVPGYWETVYNLDEVLTVEKSSIVSRDIIVYQVPSDGTAGMFTLRINIIDTQTGNAFVGHLLNIVLTKLDDSDFSMVDLNPSTFGYQARVVGYTFLPDGGGGFYEIWGPLAPLADGTYRLTINPFTFSPVSRQELIEAEFYIRVIGP